MIGDEILTYEKLYAVFVQIEELLNSQAFCDAIFDPSYCLAFIQRHLLTLEPLTAPPNPILRELNFLTDYRDGLCFKGYSSAYSHF